MPSFFSELKRRNVLRAGAFYAAAAWLLVQIATQVFPFFDVPNWTVRWIVIAAVIGFPFALAFAWFYELTPEGLKRESELDRSGSTTRPGGKTLDRWIIAVLALAVVLLLANTFVLHTASRSADEQSVSAKSIAVLPFVNMSADPNQEFFSDGIAEELLNRLAQFPDLMVAARTSAFQFKGKNLDIAEIARKLNVAHVLEGSVRKDGARLRITVQLINSSSGFHLWSQSFERDATDVFKVQDEIATATATALEAKLSGRVVAAETQSIDPAAFDDYLLGRTLLARRIGDNLQRAVEAFDRAIARDPNYSQAHSSRAFAIALAPYYGPWLPFQLAMAGALAGAERALRLDPNNAEGYLARGTVSSIMFHENAARVDLDHALALAPGNVDVLNFVGDDLKRTANFRGAERLKRRAMALDPLTFVHHNDLSGILASQGRFAEALAEGERALALGGGQYAYAGILVAQLNLGAREAAATTLEKICNEGGAESRWCLIGTVALRAAEGKRGEAAAVLERIKGLAAERDAGIFVSPSVMTTLYVDAMQDIPSAIASLRQSVRDGDFDITTPLQFGPRGARLPEEISQDPEWLALWNDPKLSETMTVFRANLTAFRKGGS